MWMHNNQNIVVKFALYYAVSAIDPRELRRRLFSLDKE